ncbi:MAG: DUF3473 domain-containing protein [Calditrichia bacterium]
MDKTSERIGILTFDLEEWFQVENLKAAIKRSDWESKKSTVVENTHRILELLRENKVTATFFILGWVAERFPEMVRTLIQNGHEVACHGFGHHLTSHLSLTELEDDIYRSKSLLEDITGGPVIGYRAPSFSISSDVTGILARLNFVYDSSLNLFSLNSRYGHIDTPLYEVSNGVFQLENGLYEIPLSSVKMLNYHIPVSGGAFFRIFPYWLFKAMVKKKMKYDTLYVFYLHPWEFEPGQERVHDIKLNYRFRHYYGLKHTEEKLKKFIQFLRNLECEFLSIRQFIERNKGQFASIATLKK